MRHYKLSFLVCAGFALLAGFAMADTDLAGKTLTSKSSTIVLEAGGTMSGKVGKDALAGTWEIRDGTFCRTISAPKKFAGTECQGMKVDGSTLELTREDGSKVSFEIN